MSPRPAPLSGTDNGLSNASYPSVSPAHIGMALFGRAIPERFTLAHGVFAERQSHLPETDLILTWLKAQNPLISLGWEFLEDSLHHLPVAHEKQRQGQLT